MRTFWLALLPAAVAFAQEAPAPNNSLDPYRVDIQLRESPAGGSAPAIRRYSILTRPDGKGSVKTGTRIPISTGGPQWSYFDVGVNVNCRLQEVARKLQLSLDVSLNDVTQLPSPTTGGAPGAATSQSQAEVATFITLGKPTVVLNWDDPQGKRRYEVEATVTRAP